MSNEEGTSTTPPLVLFQYIGGIHPTHAGASGYEKKYHKFVMSSKAESRTKSKIHQPYFGNGARIRADVKEQQLRWLELSKIDA